MERLLEERMGRTIRSPEEVAVITEYAKYLCGDDEAAARKLSQRILFEMHNRTWGVSLHEGDPDLPLVETKMVCEYLRLAVESRETNGPLGLTERAIILAVKRPHEIALYRSMVFELCGMEDVRVFERALVMRGARLLRMDSKDVEIYQRIVGKSYWELDLGILRQVFVSNFMAWKVGMDKFEELEGEETLQPEFLAEVSVFLTGVRVGLRRIARVVVAKKALPENIPQRIEIDMKKIGAVRRMMGEIEGVDPEEDDIGIDMETARSFLD